MLRGKESLIPFSRGGGATVCLILMAYGIRGPWVSSFVIWRIVWHGMVMLTAEKGPESTDFTIGLLLLLLHDWMLVVLVSLHA